MEVFQDYGDKHDEFRGSLVGVGVFVVALPPHLLLFSVLLLLAGDLEPERTGDGAGESQCTGLGERVVTRLRELAPRGQRESEGGIHAT